ncbi:MAG: hypothetical protein K2M05_00315 [Paramuribaculum sp.]|nr:hypothetical protein [Paramuribaculum sp.]MDE6304642.1 hypothetical protein [Paramuribaculum sp.]
MKKYLIVPVALLLATTAAAQNITPQQEREFYRKAYDVIKSYARFSHIKDDDDQAATQFSDLFESPNIKICNDLMSLSYEPTLSVIEYIDLLRNADMVKVGVRDVKKEGEIIEDDGFLKLKLSFFKNISFVSPCNSFFDSRDFFGEDYHLEMTLVYDPATGDCKISELNSYGPMLKFPKDFRVLVKNDDRDKNLDINGKYIEFQMEQKVLGPKDQLYYRGAKVEERPFEGDCDNKVYAYYNDKSWRVRLNGGFSVSGFNKLGDSDGIDVSKNSDMSFGLDFGYIFPTTSHLRFGVFAGVGISSNSLDMSTTPKGDELKLNCDKGDEQDVDGDKYTRVYEGTSGALNIHQNMSATDVTVPIYLDMEYEFNSIFSVYADAGLKFSLPMSHTINIENSALKTSGIYNIKGFEYNGPDGKPLVIDKYINNFGTYTDSDYLKPDEEAASAKTAIDAILGAGFRVNLTKSLAVDAGVQYQIGTNSWTSNSTSIFSYTLEGGDKVNLMSKAKSLSHSALKVNISLIYKF